jgi:hypothetical protein
VERILQLLVILCWRPERWLIDIYDIPAQNIHGHYEFANYKSCLELPLIQKLREDIYLLKRSVIESNFKNIKRFGLGSQPQ